MKTTAVIYARVSTTLQDTQSQIQDIQKWSIQNNYLIENVFCEAISGFITERDELQNLKNYIKENNIKHILCYEISRLGRSTLQTLKEIEYFSKQRVNIYFKKENINTLDDQPTTKLLLSLLSSISELEVSTLKSRMSRGRDLSAQKGKRINFPIMPYGFQDKDGYIDINSNESKIVRMIYEKFSRGISIRQIATYLNSKNIPTRYNEIGRISKLKTGQKFKSVWRHNTICKILHSTLYKGERTYKNSIIIKIPQIVSEELWNNVQNNFKTNIGYKTATKYEYLFKGKIICGYCMHTYASESKYRRNYLYSFYYCGGRKDENIRCKNGQISSKHFDKLLYEAVFIKNKDILLKIYEDNAKEFNENEVKRQIEYYKDLITKNELKGKRIIQLYKDDYINETVFNKDQRDIKNDNLSHQSSILTLLNKIKIYNKTQAVGKLWRNVASADFQTRRDYVLTYIDKIKIFKSKEGHKLEIYVIGNIKPIIMTITSISTNYKISY